MTRRLDPNVDRRKRDHLLDEKARIVSLMCVHAHAALDQRDAANTPTARIQRTIALCIELRPTGSAARKKANNHGNTDSHTSTLR